MDSHHAIMKTADCVYFSSVGTALCLLLIFSLLGNNILLKKPTFLFLHSNILLYLSPQKILVILVEVFFNIFKFNVYVLYLHPFLPSIPPKTTICLSHAWTHLCPLLSASWAGVFQFFIVLLTILYGVMFYYHSAVMYSLLTFQRWLAMASLFWVSSSCLLIIIMRSENRLRDYETKE